MTGNYLYLDLEKYRQITEYLELSGGEFANDQQEANLDRIIDWSLDRNIIDGIRVWKQLRANIESAKSEAARVAAYRAEEETKLNALTLLLMDAAQLKGGRFGDGVDSISIAKCPPSLPPTEEIDEDLIPKAYYKDLPARGPLQRSLLLKAVKTGAIKGIELIKDKKRLKVI